MDTVELRYEALIRYRQASEAIDTVEKKRLQAEGDGFADRADRAEASAFGFKDRSAR